VDGVSAKARGPRTVGWGPRAARLVVLSVLARLPGGVRTSGAVLWSVAMDALPVGAANGNVVERSRSPIMRCCGPGGLPFGPDLDVIASGPSPAFSRSAGCAPSLAERERLGNPWVLLSGDDNAQVGGRRGASLP
jgi:hypothetical protein